MTGPQADHGKSVPSRIRDYIVSRKSSLLNKELNNESVKDEELDNLAKDIRTIASTIETPSGDTGDANSEASLPDPSEMAAGLALGICKSAIFTGKNSFRFLETLEKCLKKNEGPTENGLTGESKPPPEKSKFQKIGIKDLINALIGTREPKVMEEYLPLLAAYQSKATRESRKFIEFDSRQTNQMLVWNFFTDHPANPGNWILKARILQRSFAAPAGIPNKNLPKKGKIEKAPGKAPDEYTAWASTWALAMQSTLAGARTAGLDSNPDLAEVVGRVRADLENLQSPHQWIKEIMQPWLDTIGGQANESGHRRRDVCEILQELRDDAGALKSSIDSAIAHYMGQLETFISKDQEFRDEHEDYKLKFNQSSIDEIKQVSGEKADLEKNNNELREQGMELANENKLLNDEKISLQHESSKLQEEYSKLQNENDRLQEENSRLQNEKKDLQNAVSNERRSADSRVNHAVGHVPALIQERIMQAKAEIRAEIKSDLNALEEEFATRDGADRLRGMWSIFSQNIRRSLDIQ